tara:strand:- start:670 stop:1095 length:426 start_codon:yes stop_codon:yes gene_type:complete
MRKIPILIICAFVIVSCRKIPESSPPSSNFIITGEAILIPGQFWVAQFDFPETMNYFQARSYAQSLGPRWDLPSRRQGNIILQYKDSLPEMNGNTYWIRLSSWTNQSSNNIGGSADIINLQANEIQMVPMTASHSIRAVYR